MDTQQSVSRNVYIDDCIPEIGLCPVNDPKYKKYALAVEKCLTTFDNVHEWADFISFLTKLLKVRSKTALSSLCDALTLCPDLSGLHAVQGGAP